MKLTLELSQEDARAFIDWMAEWWSYDAPQFEDPDFQRTCKVIEQLSKQLPKVLD